MRAARLTAVPALAAALVVALAAALALASCKSDDKPAPPKVEVTPESAKEKATEALDHAKDKAETAADKARHAIDAVKDKARAAGETVADRAADALGDPKTLREALSALDDRIAKGLADIQNASTDDARRAAAAALDKLKEEKQQLERRLETLRKSEPK